MWLQGRGLTRQMTRGAGTIKRILFFVLGAGVLLLWLLSGVVNAWFHRSDPAKVRAAVPLVLLGVCILSAITSAGDKAIAFTPGEVDQLFPGPFSRRQLLAYKLNKSALLAVITALMLSIALLRHAQWWLACFIGIFLSLLFVQVFSIAVVLAGQTIGARAYSKLRRVVLILALAGCVIAARLWVGSGRGGKGIESTVSQIRASQAGAILFAPFEPFGRAISAQTVPELITSAAMASALLVGLVVLIVIFDANYLEAAMVASQRRYEKIQRIRAGSFLSGVGVSKSAKWRLPMLPWLGGTGPVAWRQINGAMRSSRGLMLLMLLIAISTTPLLISSTGSERTKLIGPAIGIAVWLTFFVSGMIHFDFRGDVDQMDTLKALPIGSVALSLGQLVAPTLVMAIIHIVVLGAAALAIPGKWPIFAAVAALAIPFDALLFSAENVIFLFFPSRPAAASPGDLQIVGRKLVYLLLKSVVLFAGCAIAFGFAISAWIISGKSVAAFAIVAFVVLVLECIGLLPVIAFAFRRFDPATDTPS